MNLTTIIETVVRREPITMYLVSSPFESCLSSGISDLICARISTMKSRRKIASAANGYRKREITIRRTGTKTRIPLKTCSFLKFSLRFWV